MQIDIFDENVPPIPLSATPPPINQTQLAIIYEHLQPITLVAIIP